jgi:hypothetical protein
MRKVVFALVVAGVSAMLTSACTSPEATRQRSGGPGGDPGNRGATVQLHEGAKPYYHTPNRIR